MSMGSKARQIIEGVYQIGGPNITAGEDAAVFLIDFSGELVLIDAGAGGTSEKLIGNIEMLGLNPSALSHVILTHCHIDHIGSAPFFREKYKARLVIHELDARAVEVGDSIRTAANWYGRSFPPTPIDMKLKGELEVLDFGGEKLHLLHTPGHTPGSISVYLDRAGKRVLFGQDIHGPFNRSFGSDIAAWKDSMHKLLALEADILCEGHFGTYQPADKVRDYIEHYLDEYD